jgi:hypothetical protein
VIISGKTISIRPAPQNSVNTRGEQVIVVGFSGTRVGMSPLQMDIIKKILNQKTGILVHGDCIGADAEIHDLVRKEFPGKWRIRIRPPLNPTLRAWKIGDEVMPPKHYLERNRDIVEDCNVFLAAPKSMQQIGGTWSSINHFRKVIELEFGKPVPPRVGSIILPSGDIGTIRSGRRPKNYQPFKPVPFKPDNDFDS